MELLWERTQLFMSLLYWDLRLNANFVSLIDIKPYQTQWGLSEFLITLIHLFIDCLKIVQCAMFVLAHLDLIR